MVELYRRKGNFRLATGLTDGFLHAEQPVFIRGLEYSSDENLKL
jgi:hypothetical protein